MSWTPGFELPYPNPGDDVAQDGSGGSGGGGGGTSVHNDLTGRSASNAHPQSAITGLVAALAALVAKSGDTMTGDLTMAVDQYIRLSNSAGIGSGDIRISRPDVDNWLAIFDYAGLSTENDASYSAMGPSSVQSFDKTDNDYSEMTPGTIQIIRDSNAQGSLMLTLASQVSPGAAVDLWQWHADGIVYLGDAQDVNLYRGGADTLKTDDAFQALTVEAVGMTGSVENVRLVGGTVSGAPSTGAHNVGDMVVSQEPAIYVCTVAGTPGTWVNVHLATFSEEVSAPSLRATGKTGSTTDRILAGGTTSGAPTTGTHVAGEIVVDDANVYWLCTVGGTPGTWISDPQLEDSTQVVPNTTRHSGFVQLDLVDPLPTNALLMRGMTKTTAARMATTAVLPTCTYDNGASGVGATLTASANGALAAIDQTTPALNDRIVVSRQAAPLQNGLYVVTQLGDGSNPWILTRSTIADEQLDLTYGITIEIAEGPSFNGCRFKLPAGTYTMGTSALTFNCERVEVTTPGLSGQRDRRFYSTDFEHFETAITSAGRIPGTEFGLYFVGTGAQAQQMSPGTETATPGVISLETGSTAAGIAQLYAGFVNFTPVITKRYGFYYRCKTPTLTSATELFVSRWGFLTNIILFASLPFESNAGFWFEHPSDGSNIKCITRKMQTAQTNQNWIRTAASTTITVTVSSHGMVVGDPVQITASSDTAALPNSSGSVAYSVVSVIDANTFTITGLNAGSTTTQTATVQRSTTTSTDSGVAQVASTFKEYTAIYEPATASVLFYIGSAGTHTLVATNTTNIPDSALYPAAAIWKKGGSTGTNSRSIRVDRADIVIPDSRGIPNYAI